MHVHRRTNLPMGSLEQYWDEQLVEYQVVSTNENGQ